MGETANKGLEITINSKNISTKDFTWSTSLVWSWNKNEIKDLYGDGKDDLGNRWFIGHPISVIYDYEMEGIWQKDEIERDLSKMDWRLDQHLLIQEYYLEHLHPDRTGT